MEGDRVTEFARQLVAGLGAAGWVIGLMAGLGGFLLIVGIFGYAMMCVFGGEETEEENEREDQ